MQRWRVGFSVLVIACLLFGGCAGGGTNESSDSLTVSEIEHSTVSAEPTDSTAATTPALAYCASDSLSPYKATTQVNRLLMPLIYEGLTVATASFDAEPALAESVTVTDKTHLTATLRQDAVFSDGSAVTAADVVKSFEQAEQSDAYASVVSGLTAAKADGKKIVFTCDVAETVPLTALSFPIVKTAKSGGVLGSGAYVIKTDKKTKTKFLETNPNAAAKGTEPRWNLTDVSRRTELQYALESGNIQHYFADLSEGVVPRTVTHVSVTPITQNQLIFLGFNTNRSVFASAAMRGAISDALSRETLCAVGCSGYAVPAVTPFIPTWSGVTEAVGFSKGANSAKAVAKWQELGYNKADSEGKTVRNRLTLELIALKDNAFHEAMAAEIKAELQAAGATVTLKKCSYEDYIARLKRGDYDLYVGEVQLPVTLCLDALLAGGAASYGVPSSARELYEQFKNGKLSTEAFCKQFTASAPFLPLAWKQGLFLSAPGQTVATPTGANPYAGLIEP